MLKLSIAFFNIHPPLLQTHRTDHIVSAWRVVEGTKPLDFEGVKVQLIRVSWADEKLDDMDNYALVVQTTPAQEPVRKRETKI